MKELRVIEKTKTPNTISSIKKDLENLGLKKNDNIIVHTSLSSIGWVCGGEVSLINALLDVVTNEGTLVMPTHSGEYSDPFNWINPYVPTSWLSEIYNNMPPFDKNITPTDLGRTPECFRKYPNTKRSNHPQGSFCANGKESDFITKEHNLSELFTLKSPLGKLYQIKNSKVLLIGVDYDNCTAFHLSEFLSKRVREIKEGTQILKNNVSTWEWFFELDYDSSDFLDIGKDLEEETNIIKIGYIGNAECKLFNLKKAIDFGTKWIINNRKIF